MPTKPFTAKQLRDAKRLKALSRISQKQDKSLAQKKLATLCGWKTQATINQYLNGKISLDFQALQEFSTVFYVLSGKISPTLSIAILSRHKSQKI